MRKLWEAQNKRCGVCNQLLPYKKAALVTLEDGKDALVCGGGNGFVDTCEMKVVASVDRKEHFKQNTN